VGIDYAEGQALKKGLYPYENSLFPNLSTKPGQDHTFVTDVQMVGLDEIAQEEGRSRSDVIHRIIAKHLQNRGQSKEDENSYMKDAKTRR
jgi:hypothetical protein